MEESFIFCYFATANPGFLGDFVALTPGVTYSEKSDPWFPNFSDFYQVLENLAFLSSRFESHI